MLVPQQLIELRNIFVGIHVEIYTVLLLHDLILFICEEPANSNVIFILVIGDLILKRRQDALSGVRILKTENVGKMP